MTDETKPETQLDPLTKLSQELDALKAQMAAKDALLTQANKNMTDMMEVNKQLFAQANAQAPKPTAQPKPKTEEQMYDERMINSAVGEFKKVIGG